MKIEVSEVSGKELERSVKLSDEIQRLCIKQCQDWQEEFPDTHPGMVVFWAAMACAHSATAAMNAMYNYEPGHNPQRLYKDILGAINAESERVYQTLVSKNQ